MNLNQLRDTVHAANRKWWMSLETGEPIQRNKGELLALIHSEISEAFDGQGLMDDKLTHRQQTEVELADAAIRVFDYCGGFNIDLNEAGSQMDITEFDSLNDVVSPYHVLLDDAFSEIHSQISKILEMERKTKPRIMVAQAMCELICMIVAVCVESGFDLQGAFDEKMAYNKTRADHQPEHRRAEGGKKF